MVAQYTPKVNDKRQVVGELPNGDNVITYTLRPPTNRDLIELEALATDNKSNVEVQLKTFSLLSGISYDVLLDLDASSVEVMGKALEMFPVFANRTGE